MILKLHEFLCSVVTDSIQTSQDNRFQCPVQAFITCFAYNDDDTFNVVTQVTSLLAQLQFLIRCTALYQSHMVTKGGQLVIQ